MTRIVPTILLFLLFPSPIWAELKITGEVKVEPYKLVRLKADGVGTKAGILWRVNPRKGVDKASTPRDRLEFVAPPGTYEVDLVSIKSGADGSVETEEASVTVTIGDAPPIPPGPTPPGPTPPVPPSPSPISVPGLHVLIVYETDTALARGQEAIVYGQPFRSYLDGVCIKNADNPTGAYRIWDKDVATSSAPKVWQEAMKRPRSEIPWIIVSNSPKGGYEGPLPADVEATKALIQKYVGTSGKKVEGK